MESKKELIKLSENLKDRYPELKIKYGIDKGTGRLSKHAYFYKMLLVEIFLISLLAIFITHKVMSKNTISEYLVYEIHSLPIRKYLNWVFLSDMMMLKRGTEVVLWKFLSSGLGLQTQDFHNKGRYYMLIYLNYSGYKNGDKLWSLQVCKERKIKYK